MEIKHFNSEDKARLLEFNKLVHDDENIELSMMNIMFNNPFNSINNFVYLEDEGKIAAMVGFIESYQQFGETEVKIGEFAYVGTHPNYRKQGLIRKLMNYYFEIAKAKEISVLFLFGIANFYQQFDFEYAVPVHFYKYVNIEKELLKNIKGEYTILDYEEKYLKDINESYTKASKNNFCSRVRNFEYFKYRINSTRKSGYFWKVIVKNDEFKGYIWLSYEDNKLQVREAQILDEEAGASVGEFLFKLAEAETNTIGMRLPLNNSLAEYFYKKGAKFSCTNEIYPKNWAGMYKILDLKAALENLVTSFNKRLYNSRFYDFTGNFNIVTEIGDVGLNIESGKVKITEVSLDSEEVKIPIKILTSVYTGYKDICYYIRKGVVRDVEILKILFPLEYPYIWDLEESDEI